MKILQAWWKSADVIFFLHFIYLLLFINAKPFSTMYHRTLTKQANFQASGGKIGPGSKRNCTKFEKSLRIKSCYYHNQLSRTWFGRVLKTQIHNIPPILWNLGAFLIGQALIVSLPTIALALIRRGNSSRTIT